MFNATYLEIIFFVDREAVREDIARHDHVGLVAVHSEPVHAQELRQQRVSVALYDELAKVSHNHFKIGEMRLNRNVKKQNTAAQTVAAAANLMVLLEDVVHLGYILAADGLDDVALVVRRVEAGAAPSLGLAVQGGAAGQRVL